MSASLTIAIASGKGGTGKTSVATAMFDALLSSGAELPVCLLDCDVEEPNAALLLQAPLSNSHDVYQRVPLIDPDSCTFCGRCVSFCQPHAILMVEAIKHIAVMEDLCTACGACVYACNDGAITEKKKVIGQVRSYALPSGRFVDGLTKTGLPSPVALIRAVKDEIKEGELTLIDSPPGTSCPVITAMEDVDFVLLVTEPTPFGLHDLKLMVETLKQTGHRYGVLVNRAGTGYKELYDFLDEAQIPLLMEISFSKERASKYAVGKLISDGDEALKERLVQMLEDIRRMVIKEEV